MHNSVTLHQHAGNSANGHASTSQKLPSHPIVANPSLYESKPTRAIPANWGTPVDGHGKGHDPTLGDLVLKETIKSGSSPLHADEVPHSCIDKTK
jgi:hypothetical protein